MTSETSLREQVGFQWAAVGHCGQRNHISKNRNALGVLEAMVGSQVRLGLGDREWAFTE